MTIYKANLVGVKFRSLAAQRYVEHTLSVDDTVIITPDWTNPFDENALAVYATLDSGIDDPIGFVERNFAALISDRMRMGHTIVSATVSAKFRPFQFQLRIETAAPDA